METERYRSGESSEIVPRSRGQVMDQATAGRPLLPGFGKPRTGLGATLAVGLAFAFLIPDAALALDPAKRLSQYMHRSWRTQDGSAPAGMFAVAQTSDGFLWVTSVAQGLYRFDGVRFVPRTLQVDDTTIDRIVSVHSDHQAGLWAVGEREIHHLKAGAIVSRFALAGQFRTGNISVDPDGSLWTLDAGFDLQSPFCRVSDLEVKCFGSSEGLSLPTGGQAVLADGKGGFWLGAQREVVHWHAGVSRVYPIASLAGNSDDGVTALALDPNGTLWVGMLPQGPGKGLGRLVNGVFQPYTAPGFDGSRLGVFALHVDRDGSLWVGTLGDGLFRIRGDVVEHFGRADGLSSDFVHDFLEDREGILWVTTTNGIDSLHDPRVTTFSTSEGLGKEAAVGVLAGKDGTVWIANNGSLDRIRNGSVTSIRSKQGLPGNQVSYMLEDRAGNLWIGVQDGLYVFRNGRFRRIPEPDHQPLGLILAMAEDVDGDIWAMCSGDSRKLVRIRNFEVREQWPTTEVPPGRLAADPQGGIWIGPRTKTGALLHFRDGALKEYPTGSGGDLPTNHLVVQVDGSVMAAFDDGLIGLRQGSAQRMTTKNGLPCNAVYSFVEDRQKTWWLLTECGLVELPDAELQRWWADPQAVVRPRLYDALDGARPGRYGIRSADVSPDGRVWFATGFVVQMVDPSRLRHAAPPAPASIESMIVDRKEMKAIDDLELAPHPRDLRIEYTSPTFTLPQRVRFRYRLDGHDLDWHDAGTRRQAFYTDLPPGNYSFRVMASNHDGVWNEDAATLDFSIAPAYYQTNWFRALCAMLLLLLAWAGYQLRIRRLHRQFEMTLDARVAERTRIARDLHDTLLQSFHGLLLRFQTALNLLPDRPAESKRILAGAIEQAAEAITEGRDAVQGLRASTNEMNDLADSIRALGQALANEHASETVLRVELLGTPRALHPIVRDEVFRIAGEALRNAFRHASARQIEVELRYDEGQLRLRVRDDGQGIDPEVLRADGREGHYGLGGMRERAQLAGGSLTVWSALDAGTEVELRIPAVHAYRSPAPSRPWSPREIFRHGDTGEP